MAEYKSVLEDVPPHGSKAWRDMMEKKQALETDTTLETLLIGSGKTAASAIKNAVNKKAQSRKFDTPEIRSNLPPSGLDPWKNVGYQKPPKEILAEREAQINKGLMINAAENATKQGMRRFYGEALGDEINNRQNAAGDTYKKGGKVNSASSRADGIAQRGKTRGKLF